MGAAFDFESPPINMQHPDFEFLTFSLNGE
jgi:hypothetical protein